MTDDIQTIINQQLLPEQIIVQTPEELKISENRYRRLFEASRDGILILDAITRQIIDVNPFMVELLGYSKEEFLSKELWEIGLLHDAVTSADAFRELQENGFIRYDDLPLESKKGQLHEVEFVSNLYQENGHAVIQCNIRDITERKLGREAVRRLAAIVDSSDDAIISKTLDGVITTWNQGAEKLYGYSAQEAIGHSVSFLAPPTLPNEMPELLARIRQGQLIDHYETVRIRKDGSQCHISLSISPLKDGQGNIVGASSIKRDITGRKLAEQALRDSEQQQRDLKARLANERARLAEAQYLANIGNWELDFSTNVLVASDECSRIFGLEIDKTGAHFQVFLERVHPDDRDGVRQYFLDSVANRTPYSIDYRLQMADGSIKIVHEHCQTLYDYRGHPVRSIGTTQDITERKQNEASLIDSQQRLLLATHSALIGVWDWDVIANVMVWDSQMLALYGTDEHNFTGAYDTWQSRLHPQDRDRAEAELAACLNGVQEFHPQFRVVWPNGEVHWIEAHAIVQRGDDGRALRMIGVNWDITERKRDEVALRRSEERYRSLALATAQIVWKTSADGMVDDIPGWRKFTGQTIEEVQGRGWIQALHPTDRERLENDMGNCGEIGVYEDEYRVRAAGGEYRLFAVRGVPILEEDGSVREWVGTFTDIHDRRQAEEERDRFFTLSLDMLAIIGSDGYMKRLNPAWETILGHSNDELLAVPFLEFVHPDDRTVTIEQNAKLVRGGQLISGGSLMGFENRYRCNDGSYKWLLWMCASYEDLIYCVAHDVTAMREVEAALHRANDELEMRVVERTKELRQANVALQEKEAEQQRVLETLTQSEEKFRLLVESVHDYAILMLDTTGHIMTWNAGAERMKGYKSEEIIGQHFSRFYTSEDRKAGKPEQELRIAEKLGFLDDEGWRVRQDGSQFWATLVITALWDDEGRLRGFVKITRDITERRNVEAALREAKAQADKANLAKSEFLSRMSHELRTPLNAILGFGQILNRQDLTPRSKESVGYILKGGKHLLALINEVLDIARVEAGHLEVSLEPVALQDVVPEACALVRPLAEERHISLVENTDSFERSYIVADLQRLKQVLINLLSNAIKYNRAGGEVEVFCEHQPNGIVTISVRDTGPGISPQDLLKLFVPFERLGASISAIEGTGLGLVLSQRLVLAMEGKLTVKSTLGQGSTFTITLPQALAPEEQVTNVPADTHQTATAVNIECLYNVLCIEDNPSNLRLVETILESRPQIRLMASMQGSMGLDLARKHGPDLILLDLDLPDIHGTEVLSRLQKSALTNHIPVVIVSADATSNQIERLLAAGAKAYLTKPLDVGHFLDTIDEFLQTAKGISTDSNLNTEN